MDRLMDSWRHLDAFFFTFFFLILVSFVLFFPPFLSTNHSFFLLLFRLVFYFCLVWQTEQLPTIGSRTRHDQGDDDVSTCARRQAKIYHEYQLFSQPFEKEIIAAWIDGCVCGQSANALVSRSQYSLASRLTKYKIKERPIVYWQLLPVGC